MNRETLPSRRPGIVRRMIFGGSAWTVHFSFSFNSLVPPHLRVSEIFISSEKPDSDASACARDGAIFISHALQRGASIEDLARSATRGSDGKAATVIGAALDVVVHEARLVAGDFGLMRTEVI